MRGMKDINKKICTIFVYAAIVFLVLSALSIVSHCSLDKKQHPNSIGAVIYQDNPNAYLEGAITNAVIAKEGDKLYTVIRFRPTNTYDLFTVDLAFCGNEASMFDGKTGVLVITYSKIMHQRDCYDLYRVDPVQDQYLP